MSIRRARRSAVCLSRLGPIADDARAADPPALWGRQTCRSASVGATRNLPGTSRDWAEARVRSNFEVERSRCYGIEPRAARRSPLPMLPSRHARRPPHPPPARCHDRPEFGRALVPARGGPRRQRCAGGRLLRQGSGGAGPRFRRRWASSSRTADTQIRFVRSSGSPPAARRVSRSGGNRLMKVRASSGLS